MFPLVYLMASWWDVTFSFFSFHRLQSSYLIRCYVSFVFSSRCMWWRFWSTCPRTSGSWWRVTSVTPDKRKLPALTSKLPYKQVSTHFTLGSIESVLRGKWLKWRLNHRQMDLMYSFLFVRNSLGKMGNKKIEKLSFVNDILQMGEWAIWLGS